MVLVPQDVLIEDDKGEGRGRLIKSLQPEAAVTILESPRNPESEDAAATLIRKADVVFGCLDRESPRLFLTDLCSAAKITYFDLATDTGGEDEDWYGGQRHLLRRHPLPPCLDLLDQRLIRIEQMTDTEVDNERRLYGLKGRPPRRHRSRRRLRQRRGRLSGSHRVHGACHGIRPPAPQLIYRLTSRG